VWEAATGRPVGSALLHDGAVLSAAFSPDGERVVTGSFDKTARVWEAATGRPVGAVLQHGGPVSSASFTPRHGRRVLTASEDGTVRECGRVPWPHVPKPAFTIGCPLYLLHLQLLI